MMIKPDSHGSDSVADTLPDTDSSASARRLFDGGGEMGARMRVLDWSNTAVGPVETWPQSLRTVVRIMLTSRYAMWMGWGPEFTFFCNDAYLPTLGVKQSWALGASARTVWAEIWHDIGPRAEAVLRTGVATWDEGLLLFLERSGFAEETYHTFSYSPLPDDRGATGGMLCVVTEETTRTLDERRLTLLRELAASLSETQTEQQVCAAIAHSLDAQPRDVPFTLTYLFADDGRTARLACATGITPDSSAAPSVLHLQEAAGRWPARDILVQGTPIVVDDLTARCGAVPLGPWDKPARQAVIMPLGPLGPLGQQGQVRPAGFLVLGLNPYRPLDMAYHGFVALLAGQVASGLANARAYEQERKRAEALAELDRAKTTFFSNVSHEFRTPLTLILGPLDDALADTVAVLPAVQRERLVLAQRNGLRLLKLVNALLDFSRIEAGRMLAAYQPTDLAALTIDLASAFRSVIESAGLRFEVHCPPLSAPVYVDPEMWEKVIFNLLSNALKFTFEGSIALSLVELGSAVELTVRDTGIGIPTAEVPHLFERFYRVQGARARTHEGSGIGLALVQELVKLHGGQVAVFSTAGKGSAFVVRLHQGRDHLPQQALAAATPRGLASRSAAPYVQEALRWLPEAPDETCAPTVGLGADNTVSGAAAGARILVADDNADMRDYLQRTLSPRWTIVAAADGKAALALARATPPDLIITDVMMPELDGFGLLQALRSQPSLAQTPVLMLSARAGDEARSEGIEAGADDYLVKPFSARELVARVAMQLELSRWRTNAELERAKLSGLLMNAPATVALMSGPEHRFELANEHYLRLIGRQAVVGRTVREVFPEIAGQGYFELLDQVYSTGRPHFQKEAEVLLDRDGSGALEQVFLNFVYQPYFGSDGQTQGISFFGFDVTAQVQARKVIQDREERLRLALEASQLGDWDLNLLTGATSRSLRHDQVFGYQELVPSWTYADFLSHVVPEDRERIDAKFKAALDTRDVWDFECGIRHQDGSAHWIEGHGRVQASSDGEPERMLGTIADITERKLAEKERKELLSRTLVAQAEAERANRTKDEFLAMLGHELRNPLAPILTALELMRLRDEPANVRERAIIERQALHMARLVDDLLDVSRITRGKIDLVQEPVELAEVIGKALETAAPLLEQRRHQLAIKVAAHGLTLHGDVARLVQVFSNLITNAAKYTDAGGRIGIEARREGGEVAVCVADNGRGISAQMLPRVFDLFAQENQNLDRSQGGLGLGLAIVKNLVGLHGGQVSVHSEGEGKGSEFIVRLPIVDKGPATAESSQAAPALAPSPPQRRLNVLVVDDSQDAADLLCSALGLLGYTTCVAYGATAALRALQDFSPDIALLDIGLPGMNGYELGEQLRKQLGAAVQLVAVTGYGQQTDRQRSQAAGFDRHLVKPIDLATLSKTLEELVPRQP